MKAPFVLNESLHQALSSPMRHAQLPAALRERVLRRHSQRRLVFVTVPVIAAVVAVASTLLLLRQEDVPDFRQWQAQSIALEASWRETGDREWLILDARAHILLDRLRRVDSALANLHAAAESPDADALTRLWRERSEVLSTLIDTRRQGGVAIQL